MPESRGQQAGARLRAAVEHLLATVAPLPADLITWQPGPNVWSVMDNLCHVQEFIPYWTSQALKVVAHPGETWGRDPTNADRLAAVTDTSARRLPDVVAAIRQAAAASADALARLSEADLDAEGPSRNPRFGVKPAHFIVDELLVGHVEKHVGQIARNVAHYQQQGQQ